MLSINVYVANLQKYNEGFLVGKWLTLPATEEEIADCLREIGIGKVDEGGCNEEYFLTDWDGEDDDCIALCAALGLSEYMPLSEISAKLKTLENVDNDALMAVIEAGYNMEDALDLLEKGNAFFYPDVTTNEQLGRYIVEEFYGMESRIPMNMEYYIDANLIDDECVDDYLLDDEEEVDEREREIEREYWKQNVVDNCVLTFENADLYGCFNYEALGRDLCFSGFTLTSRGAVEIR